MCVMVDKFAFILF